VAGSVRDLFFLPRGRSERGRGSGWGPCPRIRSHRVVNGGKVEPVEKIESFGCQLKSSRFGAEWDSPRQPHVNGPEVRTDTGIAAHQRRTISVCAAVAIHIDSREQIEGTRAVVAENGSERVVSQNALQQAVRFLAMRALEDGVQDDFVPLIKG